MKLFVYTTESCKKEAARYGKTEELKRNANKVESEQDCETVFREIKFPYIVDKHGGSHRWVARKYTVTVKGEDYDVLVILKLFKYQDKEYDSFNLNPVEYGKKRLEPLLNESELENYVQSRIPPAPPPPPKDVLTEEEIRYLNEAISKWSDETMIYESEEWVGKMEGRDRLYFAPIRDAVETALEDSNKSTYAIGELLSLPTSTDYYIAYQWIGGSLYLYDCYLQGEEPNGGLSESDIRTEQILERVSFRTYPSYFLYDLDLWANVEQDRKGNFSLSPEEYGILYPDLRKASEIQRETSVENQIQFPKFIKGRAGSGKSTVLQYLYAEYFARWTRVKVENPDWNDLPPSYLACNKELVDKARSFVESILRKNHSYHDEFGSDEKFYKVEGAFKNAFMVFHEFLLSLVPLEDRNRLFPKDSERHIDFSRFRKLWEKQFKGEGTIANEKYGPDISWHVIRSFIKGHTANAHLTPTQYSDGKVIPRDRQSVTYETFKSVYDKVWKAWYEPLTSCDLPFEEDTHCWDDQDLVRYVINNNLIDGSHLGMFCDEAQDFTSIEIEAVFKMSAFSNRKVDTWDIPKVPMVFAGDEFQTLNPTGFSWPAIQAAFTEKFILGARAYGNNKIIWDDVRFDLKSNYRSLDFIVRFCNSVQLLRSLDSDGDSLVPQIGWRLRKSESDSVPFFPNDSKEFWDAVRMSPNIFTIIFPCLSNEEKDYLGEHKELRSCVLPKDGQTTMPPTLSTIRAKGLDYPNVIVYGFGEYMAEHGLTFDDLAEKEMERTIALEYFINRLYVAVSRPRDQLFIVDTERGRECLWKTFFDVENIRKLFVSGKMSEKAASRWTDSITGLRDGTANDIVISGEFDNVSAAKDYEDAGMRDHDSMFMSYAKQYYERGQKPEKARWCEAWSRVFDAEVKDVTERLNLLISAAKMFEGGGFVKEAGDCYWKCCDNLGWKNMASLMEKFPEPAEWITNKTLDGLSFQIAYAISNMDEKRGANVPETINAIADAIRRRGSVEFVAKPWRMAIVTLLSKYANNNVPIDSGIIVDLLTVIDSITVDRAILEGFGDKCYQRGDPLNAIKFYETGKLWENKNYKIAKFKTTAYPECVEFRTCEADDKIIFDAFLVSPEKFPDEISKKRIVARAIVSQETWEKREEVMAVIHLLRNISDFTTYEELAELSNVDKIRRALYRAAAVQRYKRLGHGDALNALMTCVSNDRGLEINRDVQKCGSAFVIRLLARIADAPDNVKKPDQGVIMRLRAFLINHLEVWGRKEYDHSSFEYGFDELEKVVVRYFDDENIKERLLYRVRRRRLAGIDIKRKTLQECGRFDWQTLFDSIFDDKNNFLVRRVRNDDKQTDTTGSGKGAELDSGSQPERLDDTVKSGIEKDPPQQVADQGNDVSQPMNTSFEGGQEPLKNNGENALVSELGLHEDMHVDESGNTPCSQADQSTEQEGQSTEMDTRNVNEDEEARIIEAARGSQRYLGTDRFFCGMIRTIRLGSPISPPSSVVTHAVLSGGVERDAIVLKSLPPQNVTDGEFVVGIDASKGGAFVFNRPICAVVQVVYWSEFKESATGLSAIEYFKNNPQGELTTDFPYLIGSTLSPGNIVIALRTGDTYLKGFKSFGNGKLRYSDVKQFNKATQLHSDVNQPTSFTYYDNDITVLVPRNFDNDDMNHGKHSVLDHEGWMSLDEGMLPLRVDECDFLKNFSKCVDECGFIYSPRDLVRFHTSVKCCMFTLLGGQPGTGKSSLAELYFRMLGCAEWTRGNDSDPNVFPDSNVFLRVDVQPSWMEPADLRDVKGQNGEVLHKGCGLEIFLKQAKNDPKHLYCVCFEEVNLARIEHYMADIVQAISRCADEQNAGAITIGKNVRFVGTCNSDESTQPISRRFLDRCNMIELTLADDDVKKLTDKVFAGDFACMKSAGKVQGKEVFAITAENFEEWMKTRTPVDMSDIKKKLLGWDKNFEAADIRPSLRVIGDIARYVALRPAFDGIESPLLDEPKRMLYALDEEVTQRILSCFQATPKTIKVIGNLIDDQGKSVKPDNDVRLEKGLELSNKVAREKKTHYEAINYEDMNL